MLDLSLQFYEAQRSGPLPADNRCGEVRLLILKSILNIAGSPGEATRTLMMRCPEVNKRLDNLFIHQLIHIEGYHDAGDFVKFGFPMASTITVLAWGGVSFKVRHLTPVLMMR